jgi:hypothetical protein
MFFRSALGLLFAAFFNEIAYESLCKIYVSHADAPCLVFHLCRAGL